MKRPFHSLMIKYVFLTMQALLFQAYGNIGNVNECRFSLLKYFACYNNIPPADTAIIIYTDQPHFFVPYADFFNGIRIRQIDNKQIKEWRGPNDFVHRVKIKIMQDCFTTFQGPVLYCDTDTYILHPIAPLFTDIRSGAFYMHCLEGLLGDGKTKWFNNWNAFLSANPIHYNGKTLIYSKDLGMWNAGVIGMDSKHAGLLEDVLQLTDAIYEKFPRHIAEQVAFDYCFQLTGVIKPAEPMVVHYWIIKEFRTILDKLFKDDGHEPIERLIEKAKSIEPELMQKEKIDFMKLDKITRWYNTITGKKWSIKKYAAYSDL